MGHSEDSFGILAYVRCTAGLFMLGNGGLRKVILNDAGEIVDYVRATVEEADAVLNYLEEE